MTAKVSSNIEFAQAVFTMAMEKENVKAGRAILGTLMRYSFTLEFNDSADVCDAVCDMDEVLEKVAYRQYMIEKYGETYGY